MYETPDTAQPIHAFSPHVLLLRHTFMPPNQAVSCLFSERRGNWTVPPLSPQCLSPSPTPAHPILSLQAPRPRSLTIVNIVVQFVIIKQSRYQRPCLLRLSLLRRPGNLQGAAFPEELQGDLCVRCYVYSCKIAFLSKEWCYLKNKQKTKNKNCK